MTQDQSWNCDRCHFKGDRCFYNPDRFKAFLEMRPDRRPQMAPCPEWQAVKRITAGELSLTRAEWLALARLDPDQHPALKEAIAQAREFTGWRVETTPEAIPRVWERAAFISPASRRRLVRTYSETWEVLPQSPASEGDRCRVLHGRDRGDWILQNGEWRRYPPKPPETDEP